MILEKEFNKPQQKWKLVKIQILTPFGVVNHYTGKSQFSIGRLGHADIPVDFLRIEDVHIQVEVRGDNRIFITDLASSRGTYLLRKKIGPTVPTRYHIGSEIGLGGIVEAVVISLINEADDDKSEMALKLVDANKMFEDVTAKTKQLQFETEEYIEKLLQDSKDEIENLERLSAEKMSIERTQVKNQFLKIQKKHTKHNLKLEEKNIKLTEINRDLRETKRELDEINKKENTDLEVKKEFLKELNKKIEILKSNFQEDKKTTEKYIRDLRDNKRKDEREFQNEKLHFDSQIKSLTTKRNNLKKMLGKDQYLFKSRKKEIKKFDETLISFNKQIKSAKERLEKAEIKESIAKTKASEVEKNALNKLNIAKDESIEILKTTQKNANESAKDIVNFAERRSVDMLHIIECDTHSIIQDANDKASLIKLESMVAKKKTMEVCHALEKEEKSLQDTANQWKEKVAVYKNQAKDHESKLYQKYENEKRKLQEDLDKLKLNFLRSGRRAKFYEVLKYIVPATITCILSLYIGKTYLNSDINIRSVASKKDHLAKEKVILIPYIKAISLLSPTNIKEWKKNTKSILEKKLSLNEHKTQYIMNIEMQFITQLKEKKRTEEEALKTQLEINNKAQEILKENWKVYLSEKKLFIDQLKQRSKNDAPGT